MATNDIISLADGYLPLNIRQADATEDNELQTLITEASMYIDDICGPVVKRDVTATFRNPAGPLRLKVPPGSPTMVVVVASVTEYASGVPSVLTAEDFDTAGTYRWDPALGALLRRSSWTDTTWGPQEVVVTYNAGRFATTALVSEKFKGACRKVLAHKWQAQGAASGFGVPSGDGAPFGGIPYSPKTLLEHLKVDLRYEMLLDAMGLVVA